MRDFPMFDPHSEYEREEILAGRANVSLAMVRKLYEALDEAEQTAANYKVQAENGSDDADGLRVTISDLVRDKTHAKQAIDKALKALNEAKEELTEES